MLPDSGQSVQDICRLRPDLDRFRARIDQLWPALKRSGQLWSYLFRIGANLGPRSDAHCLPRVTSRMRGQANLGMRGVSSKFTVALVSPPQSASPGTQAAQFDLPPRGKLLTPARGEVRLDPKICVYWHFGARGALPPTCPLPMSNLVHSRQPGRPREAHIVARCCLLAPIWSNIVCISMARRRDLATARRAQPQARRAPPGHGRIPPRPKLVLIGRSELGFGRKAPEIRGPRPDLDASCPTLVEPRPTLVEACPSEVKPRPHPFKPRTTLVELCPRLVELSQA